MTTREILPARYWHHQDDGRVACDLCPRACILAEAQRAFCFVRQNVGGRMELSTYGRSTGFCIDPIEKKPLSHFYPGTSVLSFGTAGCNLGCRFCQNHDISKARDVQRLSEVAFPEDIARAAGAHGCTSVAATYNDPVIFAEYAIDTWRACREVGIKAVAVTAGYITPQARPDFFRELDAVNIDLKAFSERFYHKVTFAHLQPVLETLAYVRHETDVWLEVTTLLIPGQNDSPEEVEMLCEWFLQNLGPEVPLHFSAFHPDFKMQNVPPTPPATLKRARRQAKAAGIHHVYCGNMHDVESDTTYCASCHEPLIMRDWYQLKDYRLTADGHCPSCGTALPGHFQPTPGTFGRRRLPVHIDATAQRPGAHASEPPQDDPAPAVQPKQWRSVAMRRPR